MAKLIFTDIDGTLINSEQNVTPKTRSAIRKQIIKGNVFIPVSARMPQAIMSAAGQITKSCPMISYNGALVLDEMGQPLNSEFMETKKAVEICTYIENKNNETAWNVYSGCNWYYSPGNNATLVKNEERIVRIKATPSSVPKISNLAGVHKVLIMGNPSSLDEEKKELTAKYPELFLVKSAPNLLEVMLKGVSKGKAVKIMAKAFNVKLDDCWGFGDNYNDEAMLNVVAHPFLMGNAPEDLKKRFTNTTLDNNHDGIAVVLDKLN